MSCLPAGSSGDRSGFGSFSRIFSAAPLSLSMCSLSITCCGQLMSDELVQLRTSALPSRSRGRCPVTTAKLCHQSRTGLALTRCPRTHLLLDFAELVPRPAGFRPHAIFRLLGPPAHLPHHLLALARLIIAVVRVPVLLVARAVRATVVVVVVQIILGRGGWDGVVVVLRVS